jgi:hypothetical protein
MKPTSVPNPPDVVAEPLGPGEPCLAIRLLRRWESLRTWGDPVDAALTFLRLELATSPRTMTDVDRVALQLAIRAHRLRLEADRRQLETAERLVAELASREGGSDR